MAVSSDPGWTWNIRKLLRSPPRSAVDGPLLRPALRSALEEAPWHLKPTTVSPFQLTVVAPQLLMPSRIAATKAEIVTRAAWVPVRVEPSQACQAQALGLSGERHLTQNLGVIQDLVPVSARCRKR
jgi:hypothetical protein